MFMTFLLGIKFIVKPVMTTKEAMQGVSAEKRASSPSSAVWSSDDLRLYRCRRRHDDAAHPDQCAGLRAQDCVGTSVFIMTFTALTGAASHFAIGGAPDWTVFILCVLFTLLWARIAAVFANKADAKTLNRATGIVLVVLGIVVMGFNFLTK